VNSGKCGFTRIASAASLRLGNPVPFLSNTPTITVNGDLSAPSFNNGANNRLGKTEMFIAYAG
jgi:hypothetical protein